MAQDQGYECAMVNLREDLYYRLQAGVISIPPLRDRLEEVPLLAEHFVDLFNARQTRPTPVLGIDEAALRAPCQYRWPGNVRELSNAIESAVTLGRSPVIHVEDLPRAVAGGERRRSHAPGAGFSAGYFHGQ